ncbi:MAG TPA: winged helix DNA-binding domain-containing protein [Thermoanaerobaculia bacterium]
MAFETALRRLHSQLLDTPASRPHAVVSHLGAVQAQDYLGALWAVGARMKTAVEADVEMAIAERKIVRCWPMRGTLHFVAAEDARWMLELLAPRVLTRHRKRLENDFSIDRATLRRARTAVERALQGGHALTRPEIYALLEKAKISTENSRGLHILFALAHEFLICFGPRKGKQPTFVLLDEWLPPARPKAREEALGELAQRYLRGHGPATAADFAWWSGLTPKEAKEAIALAGPEPRYKEAKKKSVHLLPPFDEYTVAYKDRSAVVDPAFAKKVNAGGGMLNAIVVVDGVVVGTWKRTLRGDEGVDVKLSLFRELPELRGVTREAERYARFLGRSLRGELQ